MKVLPSYFVKFNENKLIFLKKYLENYKIRSLNLKPIIIIKYDEGIFSTNNSY